MPDYGHDLQFGSFLTPGNQSPQQSVGLAQLAERSGLDLVTFQDHPYQPRFLDTWTLLSYAAARTSRVRLAANVLNLPLRQPAVVARSAASLDLLTGGRVELGLGAGAFWDAIEAMGGRRLRPGQAVQALSEAIEIIRAIWRQDEPGVLRVDGEFYQVNGAKRGPAPAHGIGIWLGAYGPRMLALTGRVADGWLPSLGYLEPSGLAPGNAAIDEAAEAAGRRPADIIRLVNVSGTISRRATGFLHGPPGHWAENLAELALRDGLSGFILASDDPAMIQTFGREIVPAVRELVAAGRSQPPGGPAGDASATGDVPGTAAGTGTAVGSETAGSETATAIGTAAGSDTAAGTASGAAGAAGSGAATVPEALGLTPTPDKGERLSGTRPWDESTRPAAPEPPPGTEYTPLGRAIGSHLIEIHDHLRSELEQIRDLIAQVREGTTDAAGARSAINELTVRQNDWTLGAYCASYCRIVTGHHTLEDEAIFPHLRAREPGLEPVLGRLADEHKIIHHVLDDLDRALVELLRHPGDFSGLQQAADLLTDTMLSHLSYEEAQLIEPLARHGFYTGQI
ncbi:MAG: LLM class flavin-dependent oxidoreductase [Nocardiopsaceae bacterium]|nr:LLM class flavin-dependent oxidoreductase [Nocardiopsaceae bacterium]